MRAWCALSASQISRPTTLPRSLSRDALRLLLTKSSLNRELHRFNAEHGIITEAWAPLARGTVLGEPSIAEIAREVGAREPQVVLRWALQRGDVVFPKASSHERRAENLDVSGFELSAEQMARIDALDRGEAGRTGKHPDVMDRI